MEGAVAVLLRSDISRVLLDYHITVPSDRNATDGILTCSIEIPRHGAADMLENLAVGLAAGYLRIIVRFAREMLN